MACVILVLGALELGEVQGEANAWRSWTLAGILIWLTRMAEASQG